MTNSNDLSARNPTRATTKHALAKPAKTHDNATKRSLAALSKPQGYNRELEKQIVDKILGEGYDKRIRPSGINNKTGKDG